MELRNCPPDERVNGHAHIKSLTFSPSVTIPLTDGEAALGKWQSVLLLDFDGGRKREIVLHGIGD